MDGFMLNAWVLCSTSALQTTMRAAMEMLEVTWYWAKGAIAAVVLAIDTVWLVCTLTNWIKELKQWMLKRL